MTERTMTNPAENHGNGEHRLEFRLCPGCERLEVRSTLPDRKRAEQLISAAVTWSLASSRQVADAMRDLDEQAVCDDANSLLVAVGQVVAALFDDFLLLGVAVASGPWDAAGTETGVEDLFAKAGLQSDFVEGRVSTDWLTSLRAEFFERKRLN